jgi:hypothetical protein
VSAYFSIGLIIKRCFLEGIVVVYTLRRIIFARHLIYTTASVVRKLNVLAWVAWPAMCKFKGV